jgi:hypothetical protein
VQHRAVRMPSSSCRLAKTPQCVSLQPKFLEKNHRRAG